MSDLEWTDADSAYASLAALPDGHPVRVVQAFNEAAWGLPLPVELLASMVTPEVRDDWGNFAEAGEYFRRSLGIGLNLRYIGGVRDVAYVKLMDDVQVATVRASEDVPPLAYVTLVWRPEIGGWKIHRIGEPAMPEELPRTSPDSTPTY